MTRQRIGKWTVVVLTSERVIVRRVWCSAMDAEIEALEIANGRINWHLYKGDLRVDSRTIRPRKAKTVRP